MNELPQAVPKLLLDLVGAAKRQVEEEGGWSPTVVVIGAEEVAVAMLDGWSAETKHDLMRALGKRVASLRPVGIAMVCDAYYRPPGPDAAPLPATGSLADDPQARDAVVLVVADKRGQMAGHVWPYVREVKGLEVCTRWLPDEPLPPHDRSSSPVFAAFWQGVREGAPDAPPSACP